MKNVFESPKKKGKVKLEIKYISLINSLSFSIKELYFSFSKILKALKANVLEQNNYIFISNCLINEMSNKKFIQERYQNLSKNIKGIYITNKYIINNISNIEESSSKFFQKSKLIFKKMKELEYSKVNIISQRNINNQDSLNSLLGKRNNFLFSSDENIMDQGSFTSKTNNIKSSSKRKRISINLYKKDEMNSIYAKKPKQKKCEINTNDIIYLSKKILTGKNQKRFLNHSQGEIITDLTSSNLKKRNFLFDTTPPKKSSWSKDKNIPIKKYNLFPLNKIRNNDSMISQKYYKINNTSLKNKNRKIKTYKSDSSRDKKIDINNIFEFLENIIEYFYLLKISQNNIINEQKQKQINQEKEIDMKLKQSLIKLNYSIFIINDFFMDRTQLKRKLNFILNHNDNIEQKLKLLITKLNNQKNEVILIGKENKGNAFEKSRDILINSKELDYIKLIKKLKNDNNNLANINQKIISENKLLLEQLSLMQNKEINTFDNFNIDYNTNDNFEINKLICENNEYKQQIINLKKDNEQLRKIIKKININNNDTRTNSSYFLNNSQISNIINYNTDINNNSYLNKKKKETENLKNVLEENKILKIKLNEKEENSKIKKLNEDIDNLKNKCKQLSDEINEKDYIIKTLNLNLTKIKNEFNENKNNYSNFKKDTEKNKFDNENEIKQLKSFVEEKNIEIKKLTDENKDKENKINEQLKQINNLENLNKNLEKEKNEIIEKTEEQTSEINKLESIINVLNEKIKNLQKSQNNEIINIDINNNESHNSKRLSTPSFKSPDEDIEEINNLKKQNRLLLIKIAKYESILKNNQNKENNINKIENINDQSKNLLKKPNNDIENNYISTISSMKINKLYNSDEFMILSDISFKNFKWFLMKKKNHEKEEDNFDADSYENLIWVPIIHIIDLENFEYEEMQNDSDIYNLIKKLEEKENIISKLKFRLEKYEKHTENNIRTKNSINNDINLEKLNSDENFIPLEKYNNILQELNEAENNFEKIQKENIELLKYKRLYLESKDDNPINKINIENSEEDKKRINNSNSDDEIDYYKKKCEELQTLLSVLKEVIKNILMKIAIPKKDKGEIKQILKLFEFSKEEQLIILGDKKV